MESPKFAPMALATLCQGRPAERSVLHVKTYGPGKRPDLCVVVVVVVVVAAAAVAVAVALGQTKLSLMGYKNHPFHHIFQARVGGPAVYRSLHNNAWLCQ